MRLRLVCLCLMGCPYWADPTTTSTSGMAGRVQDSGGEPVEGLTVHNLESTTLTDSSGEFGLYSSASFGSADAIVAYVQWGSADNGRSSVAVEAGLIAEGDFVDNGGEDFSVA